MITPFSPIELTVRRKSGLLPKTHHTVVVFSPSSVGRFDWFKLPEALVDRLAKEAKVRNRKKSLVVPYACDDVTVDFVFPARSATLSKDVADSVRRGKKNRTLFCLEPVDERTLATMLDSFVLASYAFVSHKSEKEPIERGLTYAWLDDASRAFIARRLHDLSCVYEARDLVNTPSNLKSPEALIERFLSYPWRHFTARVLARADLEAMGFGLLLAVSAGSDLPPRVIVLERIADPSLPTVALVGKGVVFDSGGLQIKPSDAMLEMKSDMAGAATVVTAALALDRLDALPQNLVVIAGLVENAIGGSSFRPLDIYRSHAGKTVEIHHTDAEGRLVLADLVSYVEKEYAPKTIVTVATLTGASMHALGYDYAAVIGTDERFIARLDTASRSTDDRYWRLPLDEHMREECKSDTADLRNQTRGFYAGPSMGAAFISHFVEKAGYVHVDAAAPMYRPSPYGAYSKGGTGFGVLSLSAALA